VAEKEGLIAARGDIFSMPKSNSFTTFGKLLREEEETFFYKSLCHVSGGERLAACH
jgi:hypothetical protein